MTTMDHVRRLAGEIGPRGSTTPQEAEAARYAARVLRDASLEPVTERFRSARSAWAPYALFAGAVLASVLIFWIGGRQGAAVALALTALAVVSVLLELAFRPNPLRWLLPKGESQNVWAYLAPRERGLQRGTLRSQVVLLGHLDTHRTPLVFSSDRWLRLFQTLVPVGLVSCLVLIGFFALGATGVSAGCATGRLCRWLSLPCALVPLGLLLITLQADRTPYTAGANDNATGAGIALSLAERLAQEPLAHTAVWVVLSGCEEVGCYGADAFARAHRDELMGAAGARTPGARTARARAPGSRPAWIALDSVGGAHGRPTFITQETFLLTARSDPVLIALARRVAERRPELGVQAGAFASGAYTEGSIGAKHGFRVLTLLALADDGALGEWHRPTDTMANVDPDVVARTEAFVWELLSEIDTL
jgi:hypothetical protein